ncbi:MAG TPA: TlpA disulfide reductase family protein [Thermoguttaceae bacterium]|nr:TlpA disulfide reductase family protein [Thermoguttaceae bacterium]
MAILLLVIGGVYGVFYFRPFRLSGGTSHTNVGTPLPIVELESVEPDQRPVSREDLQGQVVLLCFWGPWSEMSRRALPRVVEVAAPYQKRPDFRLLTIACPQQPGDNREQLRQQVRAALREWNVSAPVYVDRQGNTLVSFRAMAGLERVPCVYLVDRQGIIQAVWPGYRDGVEKEIQELLEEYLPEAKIR